MAPERAERLPEDEALVALFRRRLKQHHGRMRDVVQQFESRWKRRGVDTLHGVGIPLRPLFIPRQRLEQLSLGLHRAVAQVAGHFRRHAAQPRWLHQRVPVGEAFFRNVDLRRAVDSELFLSHFRPDGFLYRDRYVLSEINYGNGVIVSIGYTDVLADLFAHHPLFDGKPFRADVIEKPFGHWVDLMDRTLGWKRPAHVALVSHSEEWPSVVESTPRVRHQVQQALQKLKARGFTVSLAHEGDFTVRNGRAFVKGSKREVDLVVVVTIGCSFLDTPEQFRREAKVLRGTHVGRAPILKPWAGVAVDKGTLPWMLDLGLFPAKLDDGFELDAADTRYVSGDDVGWVTKDRQGLVLKRAFSGKDTFVGISTKPKAWREAVERAAQGNEYVVQAYYPMPRAQMPVLVDGRHVEWIDVRVELTPFIVQGRFCGALARYAPDAPGLILSPPPDEMGMTIVYPC